MSNTLILMSTPLHMKRSEKCNQTSPSLRRIETSLPVGRIQISHSISATTLQRRRILIPGTLVLKLYANVIQGPVLYYQIIKTKSCLHRGLNPRRMFCAIIFQLLSQPYYLVSMVKPESCLRNKKYAIIYLFMLPASMAVTTVLACTQIILKFNVKAKSQFITQSVTVEQSCN